MIRMRSVHFAAALALMTALTVPIGSDAADNLFRGRLSGYQETPQTISSTGEGHFVARLREQGTVLVWELSYDRLEGTVTQAHVHFGAPATSGGIVVFLCTNMGNGPSGTQECPPPPATISGEIRVTDMVDSAAGQGLAAGEFDELVAALRANMAYANVHTDKHPSGEIRGQLK